MLIADEYAERTQSLAVHFIEIPGLIGHRFAHASQVHTLAVKPPSNSGGSGWVGGSVWRGAAASCAETGTGSRNGERGNVMGRTHGGLFDAMIFNLRVPTRPWRVGT